jgi:hypothetical protein
MTSSLHHRRVRRRFTRATQVALFAIALSLGGACDPDGMDEGTDSDGVGGADSDSGTDTGTDNSSDLSGLDLGGGIGQGASSGADGEGGNGPVCETDSSEAELSPVYLAVAFDVSGSMGHLASPAWWTDPDLKWTPAAEAMRAFFEDPIAEGISASMTLFPGPEEASKCQASSYGDPDVPMTPLPSSAFDAVLDDYEDEVGTPLAGGDWRTDTPTLAAVEGLAASLEALRAQEPDAKFALVLVTDGLPAGCPDVTINAVAAAIAEVLADGVPTYVIGIQNPTEPPDELPASWDDWGTCPGGADGGGDTPCELTQDNLAALELLAIAGGTEAFLVDTEDPIATQEALTAAMLAIALETVSCAVPIPPHPDPGGTFEPDKIDVFAQIDGESVRLGYDETCEVPLSWHYDDEADPTAIELCPETCATVQADPNGSLSVEFLCEPREPVVK